MSSIGSTIVGPTHQSIVIAIATVEAICILVVKSSRISKRPLIRMLAKKTFRGGDTGG